MKSALKGWRFCDANDIIKNATEELKRLSQNGFKAQFQIFTLVLARFLSNDGAPQYQRATPLKSRNPYRPTTIGSNS